MILWTVAFSSFWPIAAISPGARFPIITDGVTDMSRYINPIPAGLVLTGIVVSVSVSAVLLALTVQIYKTYHTLDIDKLYLMMSPKRRGRKMTLVQNFPLFSIILSLFCAVISFALNQNSARRITIFLLSASMVMQAATLLFCQQGNLSYDYMMGHYPRPLGQRDYRGRAGVRDGVAVLPL